MSTSYPRRLLAGILILGLGLLTVPIASAQGDWLSRFAGQAAQPAANAGTLIKVRGTGSVPVTPNQAVLTLGVQRQAPQPAAALSANSDAVAAVVAALTKAGVPEASIRTGQFTLAAQAPAPAADSTRTSAPGAYQVLNTVTVTTDEPADAGRLIEVAVAAGANEVQGVQFGVADAARYRVEAQRAAMAAAAADGRALARMLGGGEPRVVTVESLDGLAPAPAALAGGPPLFPGQSTVDASVELTLAIDGASLPAVPRATATARATTKPAPTGSLAAPGGTRATGTVTATRTLTATTAAAASPAATATLRVPATVGAASAGAAAPAAPAGSLPFVAVAQAGNGKYRGTRARAFVITSQADWQRMVAPLLPAGMKVNPDYGKEAVVAVFLGERPGAGYAVKAREIRARNGELQVAVDITEPGGTPAPGSAPTSPFQILTLRRADLPAVGEGLIQAEVLP